MSFYFSDIHHSDPSVKSSKGRLDPSLVGNELAGSDGADELGSLDGLDGLDDGEDIEEDDDDDELSELDDFTAPELSMMPPVH